MAEIMERNLNLEEVDADALFGIKAFKYQTVKQKILFFGLVGMGVALNVALPLIFSISRIVCILLSLALLVVAVSFGCNYAEGLTLGRYVYQMIFKPVKRVVFISSLDKKRLRERNNELISKEDMKLREINSKDKEMHKKLLKKIIIFAVSIVIVIVGALAFMHFKGELNTHHEAEIEGSDLVE